MIFHVKIAYESVCMNVDSELKGQKLLSLPLRGVCKMLAAPLILKAEPRFEKKISVQLDDACRSELTDKDMWNTERLHDPRCL